MPRSALEPLNGELDDQLMRLIQLAGGSPDADLVKEILKSALGLIDDGAGRGELKIVNTSLQEMRQSFRVFRPWAERRKVSVFGSARTPPDRPEYLLAREFAARMVERGFMVITGAGGGIMQAANEGAGREMSFGCHIRLPFEAANSVVENDGKLVNYKYFFTRKLTFVKETDALVAFPGGFGTLDELFEVLTLIQTGKADLMPLVFLDVPGGGYWQSFERHIEEQLVRRHLISPEDRSLYLITEDASRAAEEIARFYSNYHSTRYVRDLTVLRHQQAVSDGLLDTLNRSFADLLVGGRIERSAALPEEANEPAIATLPRLVMRFNRRGYGRYRELINRLNLGVETDPMAALDPAERAEEKPVEPMLTAPRR